MSERHAVFLLNHLQDVNVVRPLVFMAARDLGLRTTFLVSHHFVEYDDSLIWQQELKEIGETTVTPIHIFHNELQALQFIQGKTGILVAASESNVPTHAPVHDVLRSAPCSFVRITLQHGFECLGFLHNRAHDLAYGRDLTFAADVVCGWSEGSRLTSLAASQRSKLYVSGPPAVLQMNRPRTERPRGDTGLVCENLHSVRLNADGDFKTGFIEMFNSFCKALAGEGRKVVLRPHPGGQYVLKHKVALPPNAILNNNPIYKVDLAKYAYGVSAPSSVLLDMLLAAIPVAVWRDPAGAIDTRNYEGLAEISTLGDWLNFSREAVSHPDRFIERQQRFLERQEMPTDPADVYQRFAKLFSGAIRDSAAISANALGMERVLIITTSYDATLHLCLLNPLAPLVETGGIATEVVTEVQMNEAFGKRAHEPIVRKWLERHFALFRPTMLVFCRYGGPHADYMLDRARHEGIPVIYHVDDDLLNVPVHVGLKKHQRHNDPLRLDAVRYLLDNVDLVYCSTKRLRERFETLGVKAPLASGSISCPGRVIVTATERPIRRIGYMGIDKTNDLEMVLPALVAFLRRNRDIDFQLFGSFTKPASLDEFGDRVTLFPTVRNYEEFLNELARLNWDIGISPLAQTAFNMCKANNKWIEYTSVGAAVVASRGTVYDDSCANGCGILAATAEEWIAALEKLTHNPAERFAQVRRAQKKLADEYSTERLRVQVLDVFAQARSRRGTLRDEARRAVQL